MRRLEGVGEFGQVIPSVQAAAVAVGPDNLQSVVSAEAHLSRCDVHGDAVGVQDSRAGEFIDAGSAGTVLPHEPEREADGVLPGPLELKDLFLPQGTDFFRGSCGHFRSFELSARF